jgi:hypothetical protein
LSLLLLYLIPFNIGYYTVRLDSEDKYIPETVAWEGWREAVALVLAMALDSAISNLRVTLQFG